MLIPNDSINVPLTGLRLTPPDGVTVEATKTENGWVTTMEGRTLVWSGGSVPGGSRGLFAFRAHLKSADPEITFKAEESYPGFERTGVFPLRVALTGEPAVSASEGFPLLPVLMVVGVLMLAVLAAVVAMRSRVR